MLYPITEPMPDSIEDVFGYINDQGSIIVSASYAACTYFFEGKASVIDETRKSGFIDSKGRLVIPHRFEGLGRFHQGVCSIDGGYINHAGEWIIEPRFLVTSAFSEGRAFASIDGENFGFIELAGEFVIHPAFRPCRQFSEGLAAVCVDDRWGYIDWHGKFRIPTVFEGPNVTAFRDGIAGVRIDGCWGFIDRQGAFVIKPEYEEIRPFSEGFASVRRHGKWGLIDVDGRQILDCRFDELQGLNANMAPARIEGKAGFISSAGDWLIEPKFDKCYGFFGNLAVVKLGKTYAYIKRNGEIVWTSKPFAQIQYPPVPLFV
jgi:hypothetical protein